MTSVNSTPPHARTPSAGDLPTPTPVPLMNDGGIESIILELENQARRSRELRNDARDASRDQQARAIEHTRKAATVTLVSSLVGSAAQTASSLASTLRSSGSETPQGVAPDPKPDATTSAPSGDTPGAPKAAVTPNETNQTDSNGGAIALDVAGGLGSMGGSVGEHFASRATADGEVARLASEAYRDVADDAAQAQQDAQRMAERALQHLDAIDAARREAAAAILRG